jgi:hypothetical protein
MAALAESNLIPGASSQLETGLPDYAGSMTDAAWTIEVLLSYRVPRDFYA